MALAKTGGPHAEASRRWRERHPEKVVERRKAYYTKHRERQLAATRAWREADPDRARKSLLDSRARNLAQVLLNDVRQRCKKNGRECEIDREWVQASLDRGCELTGLPFDMEHAKRKHRLLAPSIDRIDSSLGYTKENSRMIVSVLNFGLHSWGWASVSDVWRLAIANEAKHAGVRISSLKAEK